VGYKVNCFVRAGQVKQLSWILLKINTGINPGENLEETKEA